jgi:hypothetical protein
MKGPVDEFEKIDDTVDMATLLGTDLIRSMMKRCTAQEKKKDVEHVIATHHMHIKEVHKNQRAAYMRTSSPRKRWPPPS